MKMEVELIVKPPTREEVANFREMYKQLDYKEATFALTVIRGCQTLGDVDFLEERLLISTAIDEFKKRGFNVETAWSIQEFWKSIIAKQLPLAIADEDHTPTTLIDMVINTWHSYMFDSLSREEAIYIARVYWGLWMAKPEPREEMCGFLDTSLVVFKMEGIRPQAALYIQDLWNEKVN